MCEVSDVLQWILHKLRFSRPFLFVFQRSLLVTFMAHSCCIKKVQVYVTGCAYNTYIVHHCTSRHSACSMPGQVCVDMVLKILLQTSACHIQLAFWCLRNAGSMKMCSAHGPPSLCVSRGQAGVKRGTVSFAPCTGMYPDVHHAMCTASNRMQNQTYCAVSHGFT